MKNKTFSITNYRFAGKQTLVSLLCALCVLCGSISAQDFKTLKDGVEYAEVTKEISGTKVNMNLLRLDLKKVRLDVHHAMDAAIGTEKTSSIATRHGAFAAINAGFFRLDTSIWAGEAAGVLQIDRRVYGEPTNNRTALIIFDSSNSQTVLFSKIPFYLEPIMVGSKTIPINGINRERKDIDDLVIYTPEFHSSTLTRPGGVEIVVHNGRVDQIETDRGSTAIPPGGLVISATGKSATLLRMLRKGQRIRVPTLFSFSYELRKHGEFLLPDDITNGVPQLIKDGKIDITWELEKSSKSFVETRHPRTAVAKLKDGKFLMITVDGRSESSGGIGLQDLAEYLLSLGATDAMNLDGGGSSTMFVDGKVVNKPSDKEGERKVSDAILVTLRNRDRKKK